MNLKPAFKLVQKSFYSFIGTWNGCAMIVLGCFFLVGTLLMPALSPCDSLLRGSNLHCSETNFRDNIGKINLEPYLAYGPIDAVYSWVNGSDPVWNKKKSHWYSKLSLKGNRTNSSKVDDTVSQNRFRDSEELRYSLRSLEKYAPWLRKIYIVTDNQIPYWLNLENPRIRIVPHTEIFPNRSDLPVFSSPAIESHLHRIKGLSKKFIYFNDDVFLGSPTLPEDFISIGGVQRLYQAWDVPKCAPGCSDSWIGDGYCDKACNVSSCNFDYPDCLNGTTGSQRGRGHASGPSKETFFCASGCPDSWLGDKVCDQKCKTIECGWDAGDCGVDIIVEDFPGTTLLIQNSTGLTIQKQQRPLFSENKHFPAHHSNGTNLQDSAPYFPVALAIPYGTYAAYLNLSYLPCAALTPLDPTQSIFSTSASFSPTCSETDIVSPFGPLGGGHQRVRSTDFPTWTNFTYISVNYSVVPVEQINVTATEDEHIQNAVSFSIFMIKHNLLMVLLRGHDKEFSEAGTPKKSFTYRKPLDIRFNITGRNLISGINITALFSIRLHASEPEIVRDNSIPQNMGQVQGYTASCMDPRQPNFLPIERVSHLKSPFQIPSLPEESTSETVDQGIVVSVVVSGLSKALSSIPLKRILSSTTITLITGETFTLQTQICNSLADVKAYNPTKRKQFSGEVPICNSSLELGDLLYPSGESSKPIDLLLFVPSLWHSSAINASGAGFYIHATLELFVLDQALSPTTNFTHRNLTNLPLESRILCVGGLYRWGTRLISVLNSDSLTTFNQTNTTTLSNHTSINATMVNTTLPEIDLEERVDTYASSLRYVNSLYHKAFGPENRKVPAHMPHLIDSDIISEMQEKWKDEWEKTSKHRFRSPEDMQYSFAYYYYVIHRHKAKIPDVLSYIKKEVDTDSDGYLNDNEFLTFAALTYNKSPTESEMKELRNCTSVNYSVSHEIFPISEHLNGSHDNIEIDGAEKNIAKTQLSQLHESGALTVSYALHRFPSVEDAANCNISRQGLLKYVSWPPTHRLETDHSVAFEMIGDNITHTLQQLNSVRYRKTKFICINDQMENPSAELKQILLDFFLSFFPFPSQFELPPHRINPTLYLDEYLNIHSLKQGEFQHHSIWFTSYHRYQDTYKFFLNFFRERFIEELWEFVEWLSGEDHPKTSLIHWSKGEKSTSLQSGIEIQIPYSTLIFSVFGFCALIGLRMLFRISRKRQMRRKAPNQFSGTIDYEKKRYYESSGKKSISEISEEIEDETSYEEDENAARMESEVPQDDFDSTKKAGDILNQFWKTAGYGMSAKNTSEHFIKGKEDFPEEQIRVDPDEYSVSTLGMDGWEEGTEQSKKKKSVRWGGNSVAGDSSRGTVTQLFSHLRKNLQDRKKQT